jgi:hypothetical protein
MRTLRDESIWLISRKLALRTSTHASCSIG